MPCASGRAGKMGKQRHMVVPLHTMTRQSEPLMTTLLMPCRQADRR